MCLSSQDRALEAYSTVCKDHQSVFVTPTLMTFKEVIFWVCCCSSHCLTKLPLTQYRTSLSGRKARQQGPIRIQHGQDRPIRVQTQVPGGGAGRVSTCHSSSHHDWSLSCVAPATRHWEEWMNGQDRVSMTTGDIYIYVLIYIYIYMLRSQKLKTCSPFYLFSICCYVTGMRSYIL